MAYLTYAEYAAISGEVSATDFPSFDKAAENIIDLETQYQIDMTTLPSKIQSLVKKACAAQIDYLNVYGLDVAYTGTKPQGFRVGEVSVTNSSSATGEARFSILSPIAESILELTGLLSRHAHVVSDPFAPFPFGGVF